MLRQQTRVSMWRQILVERKDDAMLKHLSIRRLGIDA